MNVEHLQKIIGRLGGMLALLLLVPLVARAQVIVLPDNPLLPLGRVESVVRGAAGVATQAVASARNQANAGDVLQLLDGSRLHGKLKNLDPGRAMAWQSPFARQPIEFKADTLHQIRFERSGFITNDSKPVCRLRFTNGDEVYGDLISLDADGVDLNTWFAGKLHAPRKTLQSVAFLQKGFAGIYDGPLGMDGWKIGPAGDSWLYRDGGFTATGVGFLGRDMNLPVSSRISFEMRWVGPLNLMASFYTDALDRFDFNSNGYLLSMGTGFFNLQRMQSGRGMTHLGAAQVPDLFARNRAQVEVRINREQGAFALWVDGVLVQEWRDAIPAGNDKGSGITFYSQRSGASLRISDIKVSEWDGRPDDGGDTAANANIVRLVNNDKVLGEVQSVRDGKLAIKIAATTLDIPLPRVTHVTMAGTATNNLPVDARTVRADFSVGGRLNLSLEKWDEQELRGQNPNFGQVTLKPQWLRLVSFNPGSKPSNARALDLNLEDPLDE